MNNKNNKVNNNSKNDKASEAKVNEASATITISKQEYDDLKLRSAERDSFYDQYLRSHAEFENIKKRLEKEKADFLKYANESLIFELLPILDNLEIAEKHIKEAKDFNAVREGVDMIQLQIQKFLKDIGVERIRAIGEKFDPHIHDAVETTELSGKDDGTIVDELKPGYRFNGKLLRPALVKIAKGV